ncbi:TetR/AcrR family transcriptional regulator [Amycolatopsis acidiphila]|uniref:TetR/AcrR family transcriptional regulator n=1 Tax=Amycolatopsis acidiphila TaxID=715473 RepID=A0A558AB13_9PSEU|nr:TetR/AcrR family transcriptional regulator [Amycolatopsis acidiphila]TVT21458.1 TetR/AcrR family transcriptional regulator [Amycolatopsis acidiphila]UIJ63135.1 TetR/AcrR family transcriptional regulator [Amycolatopsis acidiphila]GHG73940.1 putative HTH-type transcriptional regulator YdeS [Amycolatopsis acidiphila]
MNSSKPVRGRPRDPAVEKRILTAAMDTYARTGWAAFTMDAVAQCSGVGKSALYLRWSSKEKLLVDALEEHSAPVLAPDTGALETDVLALATELLRYFLDPVGWVAVRVAVDSAVQTAAFGHIRDRIVRMHNEAASDMVQRAVRRGEFPGEEQVQPFIQALYGAVLMHVLTLDPGGRDQARDNLEEHVAPLVDFVLSRIRPE